MKLPLVLAAAILIVGCQGRVPPERISLQTSDVTPKTAVVAPSPPLRIGEFGDVAGSPYRQVHLNYFNRCISRIDRAAAIADVRRRIGLCRLETDALVLNRIGVN